MKSQYDQSEIIYEKLAKCFEYETISALAYLWKAQISHILPNLTSNHCFRTIRISKFET